MIMTSFQPPKRPAAPDALGRPKVIRMDTLEEDGAHSLAEQVLTAEACEAQIIGIVMQHPDAFDFTVSRLQPEHFYYKYRPAWQAAIEVTEEAYPSQPVLKDKLEQMGQHELADELAHLLTHGDRYSGNIEYYVKRVLEAYRARVADAQAQKLALLSRTSGATLEDYQEVLQAGLEALLTTTDADSPYYCPTVEELLDTPAPEPLIGDLFYKDSLVMLVGEPGVWKTKVTSAIAGAVLTGKDLFDSSSLPVHETGPVVYFASEGRHLVINDLALWMSAHGITNKEFAALPLLMPNTVPDLNDPEQVERAVREVKAICLQRFGQLPVATIIDTLSAAMSGDENLKKDMAVVTASARHVQRELCPNVFLNHHTGKDVSKGARGSSSLNGDYDQMIFLDQGSVKPADLRPGNPVQLKAIKNYKASVPFEAFSITTQSKQILAADGVTALRSGLVATTTNETPEPREPEKVTAKHHHAANLLKMMREKFPDGVRDSELERSFCDRFDVSDITYKRAKKLLDTGNNIRNDGGLWRACE